MNKKTLILLLIAVGLVIGVFVVLSNPKKSFLPSSQANKQETLIPPAPSKTVKSYADPSGFTFSYPDNLSLINNQPQDNNTYADIKLTANGVEGDLALKIVDSKLKTTDAWVKTIKTTSQTPKEVKLGTLKAFEVTAEDKMLVGALDQGVLFTVEVTGGKGKDFWITVYNKVLTSFSFVKPSNSNVASQGAGSSDGIVFEGEKVVK